MSMSGFLCVCVCDWSAWCSFLWAQTYRLTYYQYDTLYYLPPFMSWEPIVCCKQYSKASVLLSVRRCRCRLAESVFGCLASDGYMC